MIAALLARYWAQLAAAGALSIAVTLGWHTAYALGEAAEKARWTQSQAKADKAADDKLYALNARVADLQSVLDIKIAYIAGLEKENTNEKARSSDLQSQLADGSRRLSVLVHVAASQAHTAQGPAGAGAAAVDPGVGVRADLDGRTAADLEWMRSTRNSALAGLHACIGSYGAVKAAADGNAQP